MLSPVDEAHRRSFEAALLAVAPNDRDAWLDRSFGIETLPDDGPELPSGCVPYLPCDVDTLLRMVRLADVRATDTFVDVGCGLGRAVALTHLLTGAAAIGIEVQPALVHAARALAARVNAARVSVVEGDASELAGRTVTGSVFFLYCPFSGARLARVLAALEELARTRELRVCCVDLPLPPCPWLTPLPSDDSDRLTIYRSAPVP
jgi:SAM-dependent methyltransferase